MVSAAAKVCERPPERNPRYMHVRQVAATMGQECRPPAVRAAAATCTADGQAPQVTFTSFNTESGWDYVNIYDGATTDSTRLVHASGTTAPDPTSATQGSLLLQLTTDGSVVRPGFMASPVGAARPPVCDAARDPRKASAAWERRWPR